MRDFHLHMTMLDYLHALYPRVHISLHAGELAMGLVAPEGLRFHIRESIELGHAERIGHGVSVMEEDRPIALLEEMAARKILVEICLTSNDEILGVRDEQEPLPVYLRYGVPVAIATDDEGVSRSDMTHEYLRAIESYDLSYSALKRMARASVELPAGCEPLVGRAGLHPRPLLRKRQCGQRTSVGSLPGLAAGKRQSPRAVEARGGVRPF
jgi:adenosine deaminase